MKKLTDTELEEVSGGFGAWGIAGIIAGAVFLIGVIDGYFRPLRCH